MSSKEIKRVPIRVSKEIYEKLKRASEVSGVPLNSFLIMTLNRHCDQILQNHFNSLFDRSEPCVESTWHVKEFSTAKWLVDQINAPCKPNEKLKMAYQNYQALMGQGSKN
jgi:uncharacterized protein (DUF1778 family)